MAKVTVRKGTRTRAVAEVRRPMQPQVMRQQFGKMPAESGGFQIPAPRGIRPYMNPRVAVGDERLTEDERAQYSERAETAAERRQRTQMPVGRRAPELELEDEAEGLDEPFDDGDTQDELEAEEFSIPAAAPKPAPAAKPAVSKFQLRPIAIEDTDALWDWVRADADKGQAFFGKPIENSMQLHDLMKGLVLAEAQGTGMVRSIFFGDVQVGVLALVPILSTEKIALMHLYLSGPVRDRVQQLLVPVVQLAVALVPGYHLGVIALTKPQHDQMTTLLTPHGFKAHTLFIR